MAVFMMFATFSVTAFATGDVSNFYCYGSPGSYTVRITYKNCDRDGAVTNDMHFELNSEKSVSIHFYTTTPRTVIKFYRNGSPDAYAVYSTPQYVSGMPGELTTHISLQPGSYRVGICSAGNSTVSGVIELYYVDEVGR